jgi:hypothetical protein
VLICIKEKKGNTKPEQIQVHTVEISGYGTFEMCDIDKASPQLKNHALYGDLMTLFNPETEQRLDISYICWLRM